VSFFEGDHVIPIATVGITVVNGDSVATFITSELSAAVNTITAVYRGDRNFTGSNSAAWPLRQTVKPSKSPVRRQTTGRM
jgi:hypothetical protein